MRHRTIHTIVYWILANFPFLAGGMVFIIGISLKFRDPLNAKLPFLVEPNKWITDHSPFILAVTPPLLALSQIFAKHLGPAWAWDHIKSLVDNFRDCVFDTETETPTHYHRVTLFKRVKFCWRWRPAWGGWPWSGWLIPVERSGHTTLTSNTVFAAPDNAPDEAEGVAGVTWARKGCVLVEHLPDLTNHATRSRKREYARNCYIKSEWLDTHQGHARSLYGIPLEVRGKIWGVIVLDSRSETFANRERADNFNKMFSKTLVKLLEKV